MSDYWTNRKIAEIIKEDIRSYLNGKNLNDPKYAKLCIALGHSLLLEAKLRQEEEKTGA